MRMTYDYAPGARALQPFRSPPMKRTSLIACVAFAAAACAPVEPLRESPEYAARMRAAGDAYLACIAGEAEKDMKNPAGAEDIATAAHGRCWSLWEAYRKATAESYSLNARTPEERQLAHDKAGAHLRQFEQDARRGIVDTVAERSLKGGRTTP